jgi:hypothetical protein
MDALEVLAQNFTTEEKREARELESKIEEVTRVIISEKKSLDSNFVRLSQLIDEVRSKKYWLLGNYRTFGDYLLDCEKKFGVGHSQLYVGMKVARNLLPSMTEKELVDIGITKAGVLSKYVEQSGSSTIPDEVMAMAKDSKKSTIELDAAVNQKLNNVTSSQGKWVNLGGFYAEEEEQKELNEALELAKSIDPVIPNDIPVWRQTKECYLRLSREFISTWG